MSLTPDQIMRRMNYVGASDANIIMGDDPDRLLQLWRVKRGEIEPDDLSRVLPVQMGNATEEFNRHWFTLETGKEVTNAGDEIYSDEYPWLMATLDGLADE